MRIFWEKTVNIVRMEFEPMPAPTSDVHWNRFQLYITGWYGHGFESHSQLFLQTYPEADLTYYF